MERCVFLGFVPDKSYADRLHTAIAPLESTDRKIVPAENYHITATYIGPVEEDIIEELSPQIQAVTAIQQPFTLVFSEIALAPRGKKVHEQNMIWAYYQESRQYENFVHDLERELKRKSVLPDKRRGMHPIPHITISRLKAPQYDLALPVIDLPDLTVSVCHLFDSQQVNGKRVYECLATFPLNAVQ